MGQLTGFLTTRNVEASLAGLQPDDVLIRPPLGRAVSSSAFDKSSIGIDIGYQAAVKVADQLKRFSVSQREYDEYTLRKRECTSPPDRVDYVELNNKSRFADEIILERVDIKAGDPIDYLSLSSSVSDIYALGFLESAQFEISEKEGETGIIFNVTQDSRGTKYIESGLDLVGDRDSSALNVRLAYLDTALDKYGSEFRAIAQFGEDPALVLDVYKYFDPALRVFAQPKLFVERREALIYNEDGEALLSTRVNQFGGAFAIGREIGREAAISGGLRFYSGDTRVDVGSPGVPDVEFQGGEFFAQVIYDRIDDRYFPGDGFVGQVNYIDSRDSLGADTEYTQLLLDATLAQSFGSHSILLGGRYQETIDGVAPPYAQFRAGGFARLSGFQQGQLNGQNFGMVLAGYRFHFAGSGALPAYLGATVEYGNVQSDPSDIFRNAILNGSVYFGYRSPIGPLYLGVGAAEGYGETFFFRIGNIFGSSSITR